MQASRPATGLGGAALQVLLLTVPANGQETTRVSVDSSGAEGNYDSSDPTISADGKTAIICDPQGNAIHVADVATRKVVWKLDALGSPRGVTIAPDGKTAFVTLADDPAVGVIDLVGKKLVRKIGVGASPDGVGYGPPGA